MAAYYNEFDPFAAAWLRELIRDGLIADGDVDERSVREVRPGDLRGYSQCHFFAGIGGWSAALRLAGWPDEREVWTGSCPCQPFSNAGKRKGAADDRHLWPDWFRLVRECRPGVVFGEQVEGAVRHGWLDGVSADLEGEGYAVGAAVLGAHSVDAPHQRQRLYWLGDTDGERSQGRCLSGRERGGERAAGAADGDAGDFWRSGRVIACRDGKRRRIAAEPGLFPLADGLPNRVALLRGAGNAIVPQAAAEFIAAYRDVRGG